MTLSNGAYTVRVLYIIVPYAKIKYISVIYRERQTKQAFKEYSQKASIMILMSVSPDEFKTFVMPNIF